MTDIITVNYECNGCARSIATVNTAGKSHFNWEPSNSWFWTLFFFFLSLSAQCATFAFTGSKIETLLPNWDDGGSRKHVSHTSIRCTSHGRACGLGKEGGRKRGREFEQVTSQWTPWQCVKNEWKGRCQGWQPEVTRRYTSSQRCFSIFTVQTAVFVLMNGWSYYVVQSDASSPYAFLLAVICTCEWKWKELYFAITFLGKKKATHIA